MNRPVIRLSLLLLCGAAGCASGRSSTQPSAPPPSRSAAVVAWTPISVSEIQDAELRQAIEDLLLVLVPNILWPGFPEADHPMILVDAQNALAVTAYCIGDCQPALSNGPGTSRVWRQPTTRIVTPESVLVASSATWSLLGDKEVTAIGYSNRERTVTTASHERFHAEFQWRYLVTFPDALSSDGGSPSGSSREQLETAYSASRDTRQELVSECLALATALRSAGDRNAALTEVQHFVAIRERRRANAAAPIADEDFWERHEGVPTNIERRAATHRRFRDPSIVGAAVLHHGCDSIPKVSYFLLLGALEAAVLDALGDANWPHRVYPTDGSRASSLYLLVRSLATEKEGITP